MGTFKRKLHIVTAFLLGLAIVLTVPGISAFAEQATSYTYAEDSKGNWIRTQDAYLPNLTLTSLNLNRAEELFIDSNDILYIADTGNKRIVKYDINNGKVLDELNYAGFSTPRGVFVTKNFDIYVADSGAKAIFIFDKDFNIKNTITKPDAPMFKDTLYEPKRVAVDDGGSIYIIGEGVYNGVIQLAATGEFLGYFAVNDADLTLSQRIQKLFFTRDQLANLMDINPTVFANVHVDKDGIVYTATSGLKFNGMKKHSTNGGNMFKNKVWSYPTVTDVYVDNSGLIYTASTEGYINVYSKNGEEIFSFGSTVVDEDIVGLFTKLNAIAVDSHGSIWALDSLKGYVQSFKTTEYAKKVYEAMNLYESGYYDKSRSAWEEVLRLNQMSALAHNGIGKSYLHAEDYANAMKHFEVANNKGGYSDAFWEVRNDYIQAHLSFALAIIVGLLVVMFILGRVDKKTKFYTNFKNKLAEKLGKLPVFRDFGLAFKMCRKPFDLYYEMRKHRKGSLLGATVLYLVFFVIYMAYQTSKGFIYQYVEVEDMDLTAIVIGFFAIIFLFVIGNYLVTSITDGDGILRQVYMIPAYALIPAGISMLAVTLVSHVLTYNESFMLTILLMIGITWSVIIGFIGFMTVHDYTFKETVRSFIITAFFMIIFAIVGIILSIMWESLYTFLVSVGKEAIFR